MNTTRLLVLPVVAALALGLSACGADDEVVSTTSSATVAPAATPSDTPAGSTPAGSTPSAGAAVDDDDRDDDDRSITDRALRERLARIAVEHVGGGQVEDVEHSEDRSHRYDVEVDDVNGDDDVTVEISEEFSVVGVDR